MPALGPLNFFASVLPFIVTKQFGFILFFWSGQTGITGLPATYDHFPWFSTTGYYWHYAICERRNPFSNVHLFTTFVLVSLQYSVFWGFGGPANFVHSNPLNIGSLSNIQKCFFWTWFSHFSIFTAFKTRLHQLGPIYQAPVIWSFHLSSKIMR